MRSVPRLVLSMDIRSVVDAYVWSNHAPSRLKNSPSYSWSAVVGHRLAIPSIAMRTKAALQLRSLLQLLIGVIMKRGRGRGRVHPRGKNLPIKALERLAVEQVKKNHHHTSTSVRDLSASSQSWRTLVLLPVSLSYYVRRHSVKSFTFSPHLSAVQDLL